MQPTFSRRTILFGLALVVLLGALIYAVSGQFGVMVNPRTSEQDLLTSIDLGSDEAIQTMFEQRVAVEKAGIAAQDDVGDVDWDMYLALGSDATLAGDLATARWAYETLLELNPVNLVAWDGYAYVLEHMGDLGGAEEAYWQALNTYAGSNEFDKYVRFLKRYNDDGANDQKIINAYELSIQVMGQTTWNMIGLGEWYLDHGDCTKSIDHYEVAVQLDPENEALQDDLDKAHEQCRRN